MQRFTTADVAPRERLDYWRDAVCDAYVHLDCDAESKDAFSGEIELFRLPSLALSFIASGRQTARRQRKHISRATDEFFLMNVQLSGASRTDQHGRVAFLEPGDMVLYSSVDPYRLSFDGDFRQLVLQIEKSRLRDRLPQVDLLTACRISGSGGIGRVLGGSLVQLGRTVGQGDGRLDRYVEDIIVDLIAAGAASVSGARAEHVGPSDVQTILRIKAFIADHAADPDLDRDAVAAALKISVRRINALLQAEGLSITRQIRDVRLSRIARDLRDPRFAGLSVSEIAYKWGFNNMQHFSRAFRDKYALSPRAFRHGAAH